jgi:hypothetical protein
MTPLRAFLVLRRDLVCFYRVVIIVALHHRTSMVQYGKCSPVREDFAESYL